MARPIGRQTLSDSMIGFWSARVELKARIFHPRPQPSVPNIYCPFGYPSCFLCGARMRRQRHPSMAPERHHVYRNALVRKGRLQARQALLRSSHAPEQRLSCVIARTRARVSTALRIVCALRVILLQHRGAITIFGPRWTRTYRRRLNTALLLALEDRTVRRHRARRMALEEATPQKQDQRWLTRA